MRKKAKLVYDKIAVKGAQGVGVFKKKAYNWLIVHRFTIKLLKIAR
jgi:hypothetical protein